VRTNKNDTLIKNYLGFHFFFFDVPRGRKRENAKEIYHTKQNADKRAHRTREREEREKEREGSDRRTSIGAFYLDSLTKKER
jgi:hypothetical protein